MIVFEKLILPFKIFIQELKKDYAFRKTLENKKMKTVMLGAMGQICIVLFALVIMYYNVFYIVGSVIYTVIHTTFTFSLLIYALIGLMLLFLFIWAWTSFSKKILIKNKRRYLEKEGLYEQYKESTK